MRRCGGLFSGAGLVLRSGTAYPEEVERMAEMIACSGRTSALATALAQLRDRCVCW